MSGAREAAAMGWQASQLQSESLPEERGFYGTHLEKWPPVAVVVGYVQGAEGWRKTIAQGQHVAKDPSDFGLVLVHPHCSRNLLP